MDDDEGSSAISEQDYLRADDVPKDRDVSAANKVIWKGTHEQKKYVSKKIQNPPNTYKYFKKIVFHAIDNFLY